MLILINHYAETTLYNQAWMSSSEVTHRKKGIFMPLQNSGIYYSVMRKIFPVKIFYVSQESGVTLGMYTQKAEVKGLNYFLIVPAVKVYSC